MNGGQVSERPSDRLNGGNVRGRRQVELAVREINADPSGLKMAVLHHPLYWLSPIESSNVTLIEGRPTSGSGKKMLWPS